MLLAKDARTIANTIDAFRPHMLSDAEKISEQIYETAKRGEYETEYEVSYDEDLFVRLLCEELELYGYETEYRKGHIEEEGFYVILVKWEDDSEFM